MLSALARFLAPGRPTPNPPVVDQTPRIISTGYAGNGFMIRRGKEDLDAEVALGSSKKVGDAISEEGWYELSEQLYGQRGTRAYIRGIKLRNEVDFQETLRRVEAEAKRRGAVGVYAHADTADLSDAEREARVAMWSRAGYDLLGYDRQQEPYVFRHIS